ncbi:MAG TPA: thioredoxin domain-containing protein, partial [Thermoguttaceae bacterium]|nr:thioredoxin domain-containing protein [Thermoguttaceae bacterium]
MKLKSLVLSVAAVAVPIFLVGVTNAQEGVRWESLSLQAAQQRAAQTRRLVLIHFWSPNCGPCQKMDRLVFSRPEVAAAVETYYVPVKINADQFPYTARQYGITALPTDLVLSPNGQVIRRFQGAVPAEQYIAQLQRVAGEMQLAASPGSPGFDPGWNQAGFPSGRNPSWTNPPEQANQGGGPPSTAYQNPPAWNASADGYPAPSSGYVGQPSSSIPYSYPSGPRETESGPSGSRGTEYLRPPPLAERTMSSPPASAPPQSSGGPLAYSPSDTRGSPSDTAPQGGYSPNPPLRQPSPRPETVPMAGMSMPSAGPMASPGGGPSAPSSGDRSPPAGGISPPGSSLAEGSPSLPDRSNPQGRLGNAPNGPGGVSGETVSEGWPPGLPPLGLEGYCPVELVEKRRWVLGTHPWGVIHQGRTYMCAGPEEQKRFLANPDRYAPVLSGN